MLAEFVQLAERARSMLTDMYQISSTDIERFLDVVDESTRRKIAQGKILDSVVVDKLAHDCRLDTTLARRIYSEIWRESMESYHPSSVGSRQIPEKTIISSLRLDIKKQLLGSYCILGDSIITQISGQEIAVGNEDDRVYIGMKAYLIAKGVRHFNSLDELDQEARQGKWPVLGGEKMGGARRVSTGSVENLFPSGQPHPSLAQPDH